MDRNEALDALARCRELLTGARLELSLSLGSAEKVLAIQKAATDESLNEAKDELASTVETMRGTISLLNQAARQTFTVGDSLVADEGPEESRVPNDFELERETIAALCYGERAHCSKAFGALGTGDFFYATHRLMFGSLRKAHAQGVLYGSAALLSDWLAKDGTAERMATAQSEPVLTAKDWEAVYQRQCLPNSLPAYVNALRGVTIKRQAWLALSESWRDLNLHTADSEWLKRLRQRMGAVAKMIDPTNGKPGPKERKARTA